MSDEAPAPKKKRRRRTQAEIATASAMQPQVDVLVEFVGGGKVQFRAFSYDDRSERLVFYCVSDIPGFQRRREIMRSEIRYLDITEPPRHVPALPPQPVFGWNSPPGTPAVTAAYPVTSGYLQTEPQQSPVRFVSGPTITANPHLAPVQVPRPPYGPEVPSNGFRVVSDDELIRATSNGGSAAGMLDR